MTVFWFGNFKPRESLFQKSPLFGPVFILGHVLPSTSWKFARGRLGRVVARFIHNGVFTYYVFPISQQTNFKKEDPFFTSIWLYHSTLWWGSYFWNRVWWHLQTHLISLARFSVGTVGLQVLRFQSHSPCLFGLSPYPRTSISQNVRRWCQTNWAGWVKWHLFPSQSHLLSYTDTLSCRCRLRPRGRLSLSWWWNWWL